MKRLRDRVAAITGAGSGIGRALAGRLAAEGCSLALSDIDEASLSETADRIDAVKVTTAKVDVASRDQVEAWATQVESDHGAAHIIINNAGVSGAASLRRVSYEDFEWLMSINFWGVVYGTRSFLPIMEKQDAGHIVNISSIFGIIAAPMNGTYNAAKFAVRGFTEALRIELELDGLPIGVTCVHPGGVKTNIARKGRHDWKQMNGSPDELLAEFDRRAGSTAEDCAAQIVKGIKKNKRRVLVGADASIIDKIQRLAPTGYQRLVTRFAKKRWRVD